MDNEGTAQIDVTNGKAVIETADGKRYSLEPGKEPVLDPGVHTGIFLQPAMARQFGVGIAIRVIDEAFPFPELCAYVRQQHAVYRSLRCIVDSIDPEYGSAGSRRAFADAAEKLLQDNAVFASVRDLLLSVLPDPGLRWDTRYLGRVGELLDAVRAKYPAA